MAESFERQTVSFVIRLWREPAVSVAGEDDTPPNAQWRGQIEYVPTGEQAHFQISGAVWQFLAHHLPMLSGEAEVARLISSTGVTGAEVR